MGRGKRNREKKRKISRQEMKTKKGKKYKRDKTT